MTRRQHQRTTASAISRYLNSHGVTPVCVTAQTLQNRWVVVVNCHTMIEANRVWVRLREADYNLLGQWHEWIIVGERQDDEVSY